MDEKERFTISGNKLVEKVKGLIYQGNIRRVRLVHEGKALLDIPLSIGAPAVAITVLAAPVLAAVAAIATMVKECTIEIEKAANNDESKE